MQEWISFREAPGVTEAWDIQQCCEQGGAPVIGESEYQSSTGTKKNIFYSYRECQTDIISM